MSELRFFNPFEEIRHTENRLPHWQQAGAVYFLTFRMADAVPPRLRNQWANDREAWLSLHPEPWTPEVELEYHQRFSAEIERCLDSGHGACFLNRPGSARIVSETLRHFEGERVIMISFVVMPNHVHALFVQNPDWALEKVIQSWKGFSARQVNKLLTRSGHFWQRDYFDRLVRDEKHFANCVRYIRRNPEKARLGKDQFILWESEVAQAIV
jgi:REP element-mobilizing transposase RayT